MDCPKCGVENPDDAQVCMSCNRVLMGTSAQAQRSRLAVTSIILGIVSLFTCGLTALPAIIFGIVALIKVRNSQGQLKGAGLAIAGIVLPALLLFLLVPMAIMMPALAQIKRLARATVCRSNLRSWGVVCEMSTLDSDADFRADVNWVDTLRPYYRDDKLLLCPTAKRTAEQGAENPYQAWQVNDKVGSYGINGWVCNSPAKKVMGEEADMVLWREFGVRNSDTIPLLFDCSQPVAYPRHSDRPPEYKEQVRAEDSERDQMRRCCLNRHPDATINCLFADFSAGKVGLKQLWELRWHRNWNANNEPPPQWPEWMQGFSEF